MIKNWLIVGTLIAVHALPLVCGPSDKTEEKHYAKVGSDEEGNFYLVVYYHYDNMQPIDDRETMLKISKSEYPLKEGQVITHAPNKDNKITATYNNGILHVDYMYRRASLGKKYSHRAVKWSYAVKTNPELAKDSLEVISGDYSHVPSK